MEEEGGEGGKKGKTEGGGGKKDHLQEILYPPLYSGT